MQWYFYIGILAAICIAVFNMPQLIQVIKTKNTCGMSALMLLVLSMGNFFFALNGIGVLANQNMAQGDRISAGLPLLLANLIALTISLILLFMKLNSLRWSRKFNVTEKQYCENYDNFKTKRRMLRAERAASKKGTPDNGVPLAAGE